MKIADGAGTHPAASHRGFTDQEEGSQARGRRSALFYCDSTAVCFWGLGFSKDLVWHKPSGSSQPRSLSPCAHEGHPRDRARRGRLLRVAGLGGRASTLPCRGRNSSRWLSKSQASSGTSTSPRNVLRPKRSWCQTENCSVLASRRDLLISY